jgi:hypothetical protein
MNAVVQSFVNVFGMCAITVGLLSGCATQQQANRLPMATVDLNHFVVDCRIKQQQVALLQSMRQTSDEQFAARFRSMFRPFEWTSDHDIAYGNPNKYINFWLRELSAC